MPLVERAVRRAMDLVAMCRRPTRIAASSSAVVPSRSAGLRVILRAASRPSFFRMRIFDKQACIDG